MRAKQKEGGCCLQFNLHRGLNQSYIKRVRCDAWLGAEHQAKPTDCVPVCILAGLFRGSLSLLHLCVHNS